MDVRDLVAAIHAAPHLMVMNFAGAGSQALAWLHSVGGSSRTILEVVDRYSSPSLIDATGFPPEQFTSPRVAAALADHGHRRAAWILDRLSAQGGSVAFGVGLTATIATDRAKRGDHRMALAVRDAFGTVGHEVVLAKGARDRAGEEEVLSRFALDAIAAASGVLHTVDPEWVEGEEVATTFDPVSPVRAFLSGRHAWLRLEPDNTWIVPDDGAAATGGAQMRGVAIVSGAFHPAHEGHFELARVAARHSGRRVVFELPMQNAQKGEVPILSARERAAQFALTAPLVLTRSPLFAQKAEMFPEALFVIGADTAVRVLDPAFYDGSRDAMLAALAAIRARGGRFLVAGRKSGDAFRTLADIDVPAGFEDLFEALPEEAFRKDVSSSQIRRTWT